MTDNNFYRNKRKEFRMYKTSIKSILSANLNPESFKQVWTAIFNYELTGQEENDLQGDLEKYIFQNAKTELDISLEHYAETCKKNKQNRTGISTNES